MKRSHMRPQPPITQYSSPCALPHRKPRVLVSDMVNQPCCKCVFGSETLPLSALLQCWCQAHCYYGF